MPTLLKKWICSVGSSQRGTDPLACWALHEDVSRASWAPGGSVDVVWPLSSRSDSGAFGLQSKQRAGSSVTGTVLQSVRHGPAVSCGLCDFWWCCGWVSNKIISGYSTSYSIWARVILQKENYKDHETYCYKNIKENKRNSSSADTEVLWVSFQRKVKTKCVRTKEMKWGVLESLSQPDWNLSTRPGQAEFWVCLAPQALNGAKMVTSPLWPKMAFYDVLIPDSLGIKVGDTRIISYT